MRKGQRTVVVVGRGAAGTAAAKTLVQDEFDGRVVVVRETDIPAYNRTLVNKGLLPGLLGEDQIVLPRIEGADEIASTAVRLDTDRREVLLADGQTLAFDAAIVATGSTPRRLPAAIPGARDAAAIGRLRTLHSAADAARIHQELDGGDRRESVTILGGGLVGAETASILAEAGADVTLIARTPAPLHTVLGPPIAERLADLHRLHVDVRFRRQIVGVVADESGITAEFDDGGRARSGLVIVAHGTLPDTSWINGGFGGLDVDDRLRWDSAASVYAIGGIANHPAGDTRRYRIDHWDDAASQGRHAARVLRHDIDGDNDPGPYVPTSGYHLRLYGNVVNGFGTADPCTTAKTISDEPLVVAFHRPDGTATGVVGLNAPKETRAYAAELGRG